MQFNVMSAQEVITKVMSGAIDNVPVDLKEIFEMVEPDFLDLT